MDYYTGLVWMLVWTPRPVDGARLRGLCRMLFCIDSTGLVLSWFLTLINVKVGRGGCGRKVADAGLPWFLIRPAEVQLIGPRKSGLRTDYVRLSPDKWTPEVVDSSTVCNSLRSAIDYIWGIVYGLSHGTLHR